MVLPDSLRMRRHFGAAGIALALVLGGCGPVAEAPQPDVEATVQARVSATVGALARLQPTATRPPTGTTLPIGTTVSTPSPALDRTVTPAPSPTTLASAAATTTRPAATPSGVGAAVATASVLAAGPATPAAAVTPISLGTVTRLGGASVTIARYEFGYACPSGSGKPAAGSKLVTLQIVERNDGAATLPAPPLVWTVSGAPASAGPQSPCQPDEQALSNACYRVAQIPAGSRCEGWLVFELPESVDVPGALVQARYAGGSDVATWRLPT